MNANKIKYPIYIISKGRYQNPYTANFLLKENIPFKIAIEPQEYDNYCKTIPAQYLTKLPFSNLGLGSYPARNWCWEDSLKKGYKKHFLFDDNIRGFYKFTNGIRKRCNAFPALKILEEFTERYTNIGISGYNYTSFITSETKKPFTINTHIYSGMLINNEIPYRWRLKYNEDIDLCFQVLTNKWCTVSLNIFSIHKISTTSKMPGGNQTELYQNNDPNKKLLKVYSLKKIWPNYVKVIHRFGRPHHSINWLKLFNHPLKKRKKSVSTTQKK